ncbi:Uncharacterized protein DBV15_05262 [Temnothorax longispinosus]|uniref:Uncharacterized protein n=1 Tax=Temnothorax longispinosus TaxID=300112 RepID=A0A4S2JUT3_9HYME|nr:Uncharacterized protein DBV15_05262 [Temnothorax longispinosus]
MGSEYERRSDISHLMLHNFLKLAKRALEIILGIIGNVCSSDQTAIDTIGRDQELVIRILSHLTSNNLLILIQLIKFLHSVVWNLWKNRKNLDKSDWAANLMECSFFGDSINLYIKEFN